MAEYPKSVTLKDKKKIVLKLMEDKDLEALVKFYQSVPESDRRCPELKALLLHIATKPLHPDSSPLWLPPPSLSGPFE